MQMRPLAKTATRVALVVAFVAVGAACSRSGTSNAADTEVAQQATGESSRPPSTPADATVVVDLDARRAVTAGTVVDLRFPAGTTRGLGYRMDRWRDGEWAPEYNLLSQPQGFAIESSWKPFQEGFVVADIGVDGQGPDAILIPEVAVPGWHRVCLLDRAASCSDPFEIRQGTS